MYKVIRNGGRTVINDWNGKLIFSTDDDALVMYDDNGAIFTSKGERVDRRAAVEGARDAC